MTRISTYIHIRKTYENRQDRIFSNKRRFFDLGRDVKNLENSNIGKQQKCVIFIRKSSYGQSNGAILFDFSFFLAKITPLVASFFLQQKKMGCLISIGNSSKRASRRRRTVSRKSKISQTLP